MFRITLSLLTVVSVFAVAGRLNQPLETPWRFAVSGDSRNCGDIVMPAIASVALGQRVKFYWHLGDFRAGHAIDEDMSFPGAPLSFEAYKKKAWDDFIANQIGPFGSLPVHLGIGNHELYWNGPGQQNEELSHAQFVTKFRRWLESGTAYYHWRLGQVDFVTLDNSFNAGFDEAQMSWLQGVLNRDRSDPEVRSIVVGMHRALPNSLACGHSMNGDPPGPNDSEAIKRHKEDSNRRSTETGRRAYEMLVRWRDQTHKHVYVLASHSHFFMADIFQTPYWQTMEPAGAGVLPGWIVGTAGAVRYELPANLPGDVLAVTGVSGYLLGTVAADGSVAFDFQEVTERDVPTQVYERYGRNKVNFCFLANREPGEHRPASSCAETTFRSAADH